MTDFVSKQAGMTSRIPLPRAWASTPLHGDQSLTDKLFVLPAGDPFHADNRMGLTGTLHRISAIRDRDGSVAGLTYRIGRHVAGTATSLQHKVCWTHVICDNMARVERPILCLSFLVPEQKLMCTMPT